MSLTFKIDDRVTLKTRFSTAPFYWCINSTIFHNSVAKDLCYTFVGIESIQSSTITVQVFHHTPILKKRATPTTSTSNLRIYVGGDIIFQLWVK